MLPYHWQAKRGPDIPIRECEGKPILLATCTLVEASLGERVGEGDSDCEYYVWSPFEPPPVPATPKVRVVSG